MRHRPGLWNGMYVLGHVHWDHVYMGETKNWGNFTFWFKYNNIKNKWFNFMFKHYYLVVFKLFLEKNIYMF